MGYVVVTLRGCNGGPWEGYGVWGMWGGGDPKRDVWGDPIGRCDRVCGRPWEGYEPRYGLCEGDGGGVGYGRGVRYGGPYEEWGTYAALKHNECPYNKNNCHNRKGDLTSSL